MRTARPNTTPVADPASDTPDPDHAANVAEAVLVIAAGCAALAGSVSWLN